MNKSVYLEIKNSNLIPYTQYGDESLAWGFCSPMDIKRHVILRTGFSYCREGLTGTLSAHLDTRNKKSFGICLRRTRLAARIILPPSRPKDFYENRTALFEKWTRSGVNAINILEARHGWPLTRMYDVKHKYSERLLVKLFVGSNRWMRSPAMLSMFALLIRMCKLVRFHDIKDYNELRKKASTCSRNSSNDSGYVANSYRYWDMIVGEFNRLFRGISIKDTFLTKNYHYDEGLNKICRANGGTAHIELARRFHKIAKEHGLRQ